MQFPVVQIQQFLTDMSATSDRGGFDEASEHFKAANAIIDIMTNDVPELTKELNDVKVKLDALHETGKKMAETYIAKGQAAGNVVMKLPETGFDDRSLAFVKAMDEIVRMLDKQSADLNAIGSVIAYILLNASEDVLNSQVRKATLIQDQMNLLSPT